jgi:UPF0042 nucleotide-binding protein
MNDHSHPLQAPKAPTTASPQRSEVVLITGISGSGKSVALNALEDAGFFCVDNLPPELLRDFVALERTRSAALERRIAIAVDVRSEGSLPHLLPIISRLGSEGVTVRSVFLDATTDTLVRRFSETRRRHPLSQETAAALAGEVDAHQTLIDAIQLERELLAQLREASTIIDTSELRPAQLRAWVRQLVNTPGAPLTLTFESFAYKNGVPLDADMVFDVRVLPNPYYLRELRPLNGRDAPVAEYLRSQPEVLEMLDQIEVFLRRWLPNFEDDQRSYLTVAIGCTGGQHRSVYMCETLAARFAPLVTTLLRHRELDA